MNYKKVSLVTSTPTSQEVTQLGAFRFRFQIAEGRSRLVALRQERFAPIGF